MLDSRMFAVETPDVYQNNLGYNFLVETIYSQIESYGQQLRLITKNGQKKEKGTVEKLDQWIGKSAMQSGKEFDSDEGKIMKIVMLRGIVNHSYSKLQQNSDWNESQIGDNRLRDTNHYEVLEKYDEVENKVEIGTKVRFE